MQILHQIFALYQEKMFPRLPKALICEFGHHFSFKNLYKENKNFEDIFTATFNYHVHTPHSNL